MSEVSSVNGQTGVVILTASDVEAVPASAEGQPGGVATLGGSGRLVEAQLPGSVEGSSAIAKANALVGATTCIVTTTENSANVIGTGTAWTNLLVGQWMHIPGGGEHEEDLLAEIASVKSATELTLSAEAKNSAASATATVGMDCSLLLNEGCSLAATAKGRFFVPGLMLMVAHAVNTQGVLEAHPEAASVGYAVCGMKYARSGEILRFRTRSNTGGARVGAGFFTPRISANKLTTLTNSTSGEDSYGKYFLTNEPLIQCNTNAIEPVTPGATYWAVLTLEGTLPNEVTFNSENSKGEVVGTTVGTPFGSGYSVAELTASPAEAEPIQVAFSFTVPAAGEATHVQISLKGYTGRSTKLYSIAFAAASAVPAKRVRDIPIPYRGFTFQQFGQLSWLTASTMNPGRAYKKLALVDSNFHPDGLRIMFSLDAGMSFSAGQSEEERKGHPTALTNTGLERAEHVMALTYAMGLTVVPVLLTPVRGGTGDEWAVTNREILTSTEVRAAYIERLKEWVARFEHYPHIAGWDIVNESAFSLLQNRSGSKKYNQAQIASAITEIFTEIRKVTAKRLILSLADGGAAVHQRLLLAQDLYDIADQHSYGDIAKWDLPTMQHTLVALEVGPAKGEETDEGMVEKVAPLITTGANVVSAAWMWMEGWLITTGVPQLTSNKHYINLAKRY